MSPPISEAEVTAQVAQLSTLRAAIAQAIVGQEEVVEQLLIGLLAGGHCLLEGVPGLGKTLLVRSLGQALALQFRRIQFTPDLMPATSSAPRSSKRTTAPASATSSSSPGRCSPTCCWPTNSTARRRRPRPPCWRRCRNTPSAMPASPMRCRSRSSCWPRRIRSSRPAPIRCPKRSSIVSCCTSASTIRARPRSATSCSAPPACAPRRCRR